MSTESPPGEAARPSPSSPSLFRILLIVSLALNMFFLGAGAVVLGRFVFNPHGGAPMGIHELGEFPGPGLMMRALPPGERARIEKELGPERAQMHDAMMAARHARREAFEAFRADPFLPEILQQKLEAARAADLAAVSAAHRVIERSSATLTAEDRAAVAKAMRERKGFNKEGKPPSDDDGPPRDGGPAPGHPPDSP